MNKYKTFTQKTLRNSAFFVAIILISNLSIGQDSKLELSKIMAGNAFIGEQPHSFVWDGEGKQIYFKWNPDQALNDVHYCYDVAKGTLNKVIFDQANPVPIFGILPASESVNTYFKIGNSLYSKYQGKTKRIYSSTISYSLLKIHQDQLYFRQDNNIYRFSPNKGELIQLTNFMVGSQPSENATTDLRATEFELFATLRDKAASEAARNNYTDAIKKGDVPKPYYLNGWTLDEISIGNNAKFVAFVLMKRAVANDPTFFMNYITENGYAKEEVARPKVGMNLDQYALRVINLVKDTTINFSFDALTGLNRIPDFYQDYPGNYPKTYKKELVFHLHGFNEDERYLLLEIKSQDNKDRWIGYIDLATQLFIETHHQHDEAWIGGPGISGWNSSPGNVEWISKDTYYFQDEKTGYSHLYQYSISTKQTSALTTGNFEIHDATLSSDKKSIYVTANKNHLGNREFYQLSLADKSLKPILTADGRHDVILSPTEDQLLISYSFKNKPWELYIAKNEENAKMKQITQSQKEKFKAYPWRAPEVIRFNARDGQAIHARIYEPDTLTKNNAAILFVHGAGYLQNAHNWWSSYYREYMFHNLLCDLGYTVLDVDYRASEGYGRNFRTAIYRQMGGQDLSDFIDARSFLIQEKDIDSSRIGIYGGSYGGFITLMALLTEPGKFKCGAAIRSVTDWAHYNHAYTSNILNTPAEDPIAYKRSSPIYFADQLSDRLLMLHGMVDDNVQYQDVVRLSQRFIELGKTNWDLIGYPIEPHGFQETTSWIDEYGRILKLFEEELR